MAARTAANVYGVGASLCILVTMGTLVGWEDWLDGFWA